MLVMIGNDVTFSQGNPTPVFRRLVSQWIMQRTDFMFYFTLTVGAPAAGQAEVKWTLTRVCEVCVRSLTVPPFSPRAPAPALQPPARLLGAGVRPPHEAAVAGTGGEPSGRRRAAPRPQQPPVPWQHQSQSGGKSSYPEPMREELGTEFLPRANEGRVKNRVHTQSQ